MPSMGPINVSAVRAAHGELWRSINAALDAEARDAGDYARQYVATKPLGFRHRTGNLKRSTESRTVRTRSGRIVRIRNTATNKAGANYPKFLERGTRSGIAATWFLKRTTEATFERFSRRLDRRVAEAVARFNRR